MMSDWLNKRLSETAKKYDISESELMRIALILLFATEEDAMKILTIEDYEHVARKGIESNE